MNIMLSLSRDFHRDRSQFICHKINERSCFISKLGGVLLVNDVKRERRGKQSGYSKRIETTPHGFYSKLS